MSLTIAIDGPSGSGKSTLSRNLARAYGLAYLDTGSQFRAVTLWCLRQGVELTDEDAVAAAARECPLRMNVDPAAPGVFLGDEDVTDLLHTAEISAVVSHVAVNLRVRSLLAQLQRSIIAAERFSGTSGGRGVVAEGRDITSRIAPEAEVRILLVADPSARLERRALERHGSSDADSIAATRDEVLRRDAQDSTVSEFQRASDGVVELDNSQFTPEETLAAAIEIVRATTGMAPVNPVRAENSPSVDVR